MSVCFPSFYGRSLSPIFSSTSLDESFFFCFSSPFFILSLKKQHHCGLKNTPGESARSSTVAMVSCQCIQVGQLSLIGLHSSQARRNEHNVNCKLRPHVRSLSLSLSPLRRPRRPQPPRQPQTAPGGPGSSGACQRIRWLDLEPIKKPV